MSAYHRTQILLEDWQYRALKSLAQREGGSISDMVRRLLDRQMRPKSSSRKGLHAIAGLGRDPKASGKNHDRWLYGQD